LNNAWQHTASSRGARHEECRITAQRRAGIERQIMAFSGAAAAWGLYIAPMAADRSASLVLVARSAIPLDDTDATDRGAYSSPYGRE